MGDTWLSNPLAALRTLGDSVRRGLDGLRGSRQHAEVERSLEESGDLPARLTQLYALIDQARIAAPKHPERAALLAVEAMHRSAGCPAATHVAAEQVLRDSHGQLGAQPLPGNAVWDLTDPEPNAAVRNLPCHPEGLSAVALSPDGRIAYTAGVQFGDPSDRAILIWPLDPEALLQAAARTLSRNLLVPEWARVFPNEPYRCTFPDLPDGRNFYTVMIDF